ncbi:unnamed protein product [Linum tenue]|uniref:Peroxidase n=1 Tax=Linum tenue TaxID=586396 RepID=A0AAV0PVJ3_9ROSI|nr:unnamed protein product [Linum tenue]
MKSALMMILACLLAAAGTSSVAALFSINLSLTLDFYASTCPGAAAKIKEMVDAAVQTETRMGASLLRLHFHDCFGCDASVLLDDVLPSFVGEKTAPPNDNSLRGFEVINNIKTEVEKLCPGKVSCADILTVAARDAVVALGGPSWQVPLGRKDSTTANFTDALVSLPSPFLDLSDLADAFASKGFSTQEMITLSGAHTVGKARCGLFRQRAHSEGNIDPAYAAFLQSICPGTDGVGDDNLAPLDNSTTTDTFDRGYYLSLVGKKGLLHSDQALLPNGGSSSTQINTYNSFLLGSVSFFTDFSNAMVKMGKLTGPAGNVGQIRTDCSRVN